MTKIPKQKPAQKTKYTAKLIERDTIPKNVLFLKRKLCILLCVVSFLVYANTLDNGYAGDDDLFISYNQLVNKGIAGIPELLSTPHMEGIVKDPNDTYRPLSLIMFAIEHDLFGNNPATGHLINILLFCGCVIALFIFLHKFMEQRRPAMALLASILFAVHPIHTEVVANIKSRDELLCFFSFLSLNFFVNHVISKKYIHLLIGSFMLFLSLLSKETSISFIVIVPLIFFFYLNENKKRSIEVVAASGIAIVMFLGLRSIILTGISLPVNDNQMPFIYNQLTNVPTGESRLATAILGCGYYIKLLFVPYPLLSSYSYETIPFVNFNNATVLISLLIYLSLITYSVYQLIKHKKDLLAFSILFYLITIAIFTNIVFLIPGFVAERFLFFASAGFCLSMAIFAEKLFTPQAKENNIPISIFPNTKSILLIMPIIIVLSSMTVLRNKNWENDYILSKTDVEQAPRNVSLYRHLGYVLSNNLNNEELRPEVKMNMLEQGITYFKQAISIYPAYADAHAGLSQLYLRKRMFDSAEVHAKTLISLDTTTAIGYNCLGNIYFATGKFSKAIYMYTKETRINPGIQGKYQNIGTCYLNMRVYDSAIMNFKRELALGPENPLILYDAIAQTFQEMGKPDSAKRYEQLMKRWR